MEGVSEPAPRKTVDCAICAKPFTWKKDVAAGETVDTLEAFGAIVCPVGLAHAECADDYYTPGFLHQWQLSVDLGLAKLPVIKVPVPGVVMKTAKMEYIKP